MLNYFRYIQNSVFKHKTIWVSVGLYWIYLFLILVLVPFIVNLSPTSLWNNTIFDLQSFSILILAIVCAIVVVVIFREGRDDGSELIIMSKSISRWKIILAKFICFLLNIFLMTILSMLIMLGVLFFGKYNAISNPNGVNYHDVFTMEMGLFLGTIIIALFFGAIAILISTIATKVIIIISTVGVGIVFNVIYMLVPILSITPSQYILDKYSVGLISNRYIGLDGQMHDIVASDHVRYTSDDHDDPNTNWNTLRYINDGNTHATGAIISYINVAQQLSSLFHTFDISSTVANHSAFGQQFNRKYQLVEQKNIFMNPTSNSRPWISWKYDEQEGIPIIYWKMYGVELDLLDIYAMSGANANSLFYIKPSNPNISNITSSKFYGVENFMNFPTEAAYQKTRAYVDKLETPELNTNEAREWWGYNKNAATDSNPFGTKYIKELRKQYTRDLFEDNESDIFYNNPNFPLPYKVEPNNSDFNDPMNVDFLTIYYMLFQDVEQALWNYMDQAIEHFSDDDGLPPFNEWTDKGQINSIAQRLNPKGNFVNQPFLRHLYEANAYLTDNFYKNENFLLYNFPSFSTNKNDTDGIFEYANPKYHMAQLYQEFPSSDVFSNTFAYKQEPYYNSDSLTIFWSCFALILFGITAMVYARTDIK